MQENRRAQPRQQQQRNTGGGGSRQNQPTMVKWILKTGLVKDPKQAEYILIGIAVVAIAIALFYAL